MASQSNEMRFSDFTILGPLPEDSDCFMAVNALTESVALLGRDTVDAIKQGISIDHPQFSDELEALASSSIIVPKDKNEIYALRYAINSKLRPDRSYRFLVLPTMDCNLKCPYCYASRARGSERMTEDTAAKVANWIKDQIEVRDLDMAELSFSGGEALLCSSIVLKLSSEIAEFCSKRGTGFHINMLSNGVNLTKEFVEQMLDCAGPSIKFSVQITFDGPEEIHNVRRIQTDGSGSFAEVMRNLHALTSLDAERKSRFATNVRINVDHQNIHGIVPLVGQLKPLIDAGIVKSAYMAPITPEHNSHDKYVLSHDDWLAMAPPIWRQVADAYGLDLSIHRKMTLCCVFREIGINIGPDGSLYLCDGAAGDHNWSVGHVDTGIDIDAYHENLGLMPWSECVGKCPVVTWCWGGCREHAFGYTGDRKARNCNKAHIMAEALVCYRFKHRDRIAKWLENRKQGIEGDGHDEFADYREVLVS